MTVAAVILVPEPAAGLRPVEGEPALRRVAQAAWSGGAIPIVIVTPDPTPELRAAVADVDVAFAQPGPDEPRGIAWFVRGARLAQESVADTTAALLWPVPRVWVDPETITSLVEAHGATPAAILRPAYKGQAGFPPVVPASLFARLAARSGMHGEEALAALVEEGVAARPIELGDPGIVHDASTSRADLPPYQGPPEPAGGPAADWTVTLSQAADPQA